MTDKQIIAVVGATGAQGGGLVRAILSDPESPFSVRALTRNVESKKARGLESMGAEVVAADVGDVESLKGAFSGAYGAFCVSFFWEHFSPEAETAEARNMAIAAEHLTGQQMSGALSRALGREVYHNDITPDDYRGCRFPGGEEMRMMFKPSGFPGVEDLGNMFQFNRDFEDDFCGVRDLDMTRSLNPGIASFETWLDRWKSFIPVPD
ncbi:MAG: NmrA family NAD(P)-binding protein [Acidobacteria bacterium]|nr:NmrA family NAD(P)-binding protein [Acidobacteriota bacterium]